MKKITVASVLMLSVLCGGEASASAFQIWEQDEAGLGNAHAGGAAEANNASTSWSNPAGMIRLDQPEFSMGAAFIYPEVEFKGTVKPVYGILGEKNVEGQGGKKILPVPNMHFVYPFKINDRKMAVGFSVVSVYDSFTNYGDRGDVLEFASDIASVKSINFGPTFALAVTEKLSVGFGVFGSYSYNEISQGGVLPAENYPGGTIGYPGAPWLASATVDPGTFPGGSVYIDNNFSGFGIGGQLGLLYQFTDKTRVGMTYFSPVKYHYNGTSRRTSTGAFENGFNVNGNIKAFGGIINLPITIPIGPLGPDKQIDTSFNWTLPEYVVLSAFHSYKQFDFMATTTWTHWSRIQSMNVKTLDGVGNNETTVSLPENFKDTFSVLLGMNYKLNEKFKVKFGTGYDMSPTNDGSRNLQLPDSNRIMFATGVEYAFHPDTIFNLGYMYVYAVPTKVNYVAPPLGTKVRGDVKASAHVLGAQMTLKF